MKEYKSKKNHESCRTASAEYKKTEDRREELKQKGVICSAIADLHNDTVVVKTTLGLYYRIVGRENYKMERNDKEEGTIDGLRASGVAVLNSRSEEFSLAISS